MVRTLLHTLFALAALAVMAGCAVYPAMTVAGHAMTGYDAAVLADEYLPRKSVEGGERCSINTDRMLERRLRERLYHYNHTTVAGHVIDGKAYLVGPVASRTQADHAIKVAASVQGLRTIVCKFYHAPTPKQIAQGLVLQNELNDRLTYAPWVKAVDLRIEFVGTNAILIGKTADHGQKAEALAIASEVGGITNIVDYISVTQPLPENYSQEDHIASK